MTHKDHPQDPKIIILDPSMEENAERGEGEYKQAIHQLSGQKFPMVFRFFALFVSMILMIVTLFLLASTLIAVATVLITLGMNKQLIRTMHAFWGMFKKMVVFTLGFVIAIFNPPFGIGVVTLYFMMRGESLDSNVAGRMFTARFGRH